MKIGDEVFVHGYVDEIRDSHVIIRNDGGYFGTVRSEIRPDIWQDRYIYWIAVAIGHILEWIVKHGTNGVDADNSITDSYKGE